MHSVLRLVHPVTLEGPDVFGRRRVMHLEPVEERSWYWKPRDRWFLPIKPNMLDVRTQSVGLQFEDVRGARTIEHLLPLRFMGLVGVGLICDSWLPYLATEEIWDALTVTSEASAPLGQCQTISRAIFVGNDRRWIKAWPRKQPGIKLTLTRAYEGLPSHTESDIVGPELVKRVAGVRSQGWPPYRYWAYRALRLVGSPLPISGVNVTWPQEVGDPFETARLFTLHGILDFLGVLAVLPMEIGLEVESYRSGHALDVEFVKRVDELLR